MNKLPPLCSAYPEELKKALIEALPENFSMLDFLMIGHPVILEYRTKELNLNQIETTDNKGNPYRDSKGRFADSPFGPKVAMVEKGGNQKKIDAAKKRLKASDKTSKKATKGTTGVKSLDRLQSLGKLKPKKMSEFAKDGDPAMTTLSHNLGLDKKPAIITKAEAKKEIADGATEMFRGYRTSEAQKFKTSYANDAKMRVAYGVYGSGTYMTANKDVATFYADLNPKNVGHYVIAKDAKGIDYNKAKKTMIAEHEKVQKEYLKVAKTMDAGEREILQDNIKTVYSDAGRWAATSGYDYITYQGSSDSQEMSVLNRGKVMVVK